MACGNSECSAGSVVVGCGTSGTFGLSKNKNEKENPLHGSNYLAFLYFYLSSCPLFRLKVLAYVVISVHFYELGYHPI